MRSDPVRQAVLLGAVLAVAGAVIVAVTWRATAGEIAVHAQLRALALGGAGALCLVATGCALVGWAVDRSTEASEERALRRLLRGLARTERAT